jgi:hypothetical protein
MIAHMIRSKKALTTSQIARLAKCSERSITNIRTNMRQFGTARSPQIRTGQAPCITTSMVDALCDHLTEKPGLYLEEMAVFLWDEFNILPYRQLSNEPFPKRAGRKRNVSKRQKKRTRSCEISININYPSFAPTI